jgi:GNAT superfamily N-acetyltransferase
MPAPEERTLDRIEVTGRPTKEERHVVAHGLGDFNRAAYGPLRGAERWIFARDAAGTIQGGARCDIAWGWLYVDWLWVAEARRGAGLGTRLLGTAEALARETACLGVHLNTWSFQAPGFYAKQGYTEAGRVADMPPGAIRHWFIKPFPKETPA